MFLLILGDLETKLGNEILMRNDDLHGDLRDRDAFLRDVLHDHDDAFHHDVLHAHDAFHVWHVHLLDDVLHGVGHHDLHDVRHDDVRPELRDVHDALHDLRHVGVHGLHDVHGHHDVHCSSRHHVHDGVQFYSHQNLHQKKIQTWVLLPR